MHSLQGPITLAARVLMAIIFVSAGIEKIADPAGPMQFLQDRGLPLAGLLIWIAIVIEVGGGALLLAGYRARLAASLLIVFLVAATLLYHDFWSYTDEPMRQRHLVGFLKNLSILGALLLVLGQGAGRMSIDNGRHGERTQYW